MEKGYLYIAYGEAFTKEALLSIQSLRRFTNLPIALFTDQPENLYKDAKIDVVKNITANHIRAKVDYIDQTPFEKTVFLDTDTVVIRNCDDMFDLLDRFDMACVIDFARKRKKYSDTVPEYGRIPYAFSELNSGVIAFNSSQRTKDALKMWKQYFYKYFRETNGWDQVSFRVALWHSDVKIIHMPFEYNVRSKDNREKQRKYKHEFGEDHMESRIIHIHYDNEIHKGKFNIESLEQLEKIVKEKAVDY
jgi:hypothetical protein